MKWFRRILAMLLVLVVAIIGGALLVARSSIQELDGTITVRDSSGEIEILRDSNGIPHIFAGDESGAYFGLGFVHAQDRLWQMELARRAGAGRLSEVFGERALRHDRYFRTLGFTNVARKNLAHLEADNLSLTEAYAAGVNQAMATWDGAWPIEMKLFGVVPEPWQPTDSILAGKMMAVQLAWNAREEALRWKLRATLTEQQIDTLFPINPGDGPRPDQRAALDPGLADLALAVLPKTPPAHVGSNNWVVAGAHSASGLPLLANDPHLGLSAPAPWYLAHLSAPGFDVAGATIPGIPAVIIGRNQATAWGVTNTGPDVQDLFIVTADDVIENRLEVIRVKDGDTVEQVVRTTGHGPIVTDAGLPMSDMPVPDGKALALAWTALADDDVTIEAGFALAKATNAADVIDGLRSFHGPQMNFIVGDTEDSIAFVAAGRVPLRRDHDGWVPSDSATGKGDWIGHIPFDDLPTIRDPTSGQLFTANNRVTPDGYPYMIARSWPISYRARRIATMLAARDKHGIADFQAMQTDILSLMAVEFLPRLLAVAPPDDKTKLLHDIVANWDGTMATDQAAPLIFQAWYRALARRVFEDELGESFNEYFGRRPAAMRQILSTDTVWCDDTRTDERETCEDLIASALADADTWLSERHGDDPATWRWGDAHHAVSRNPVLSSLPVIGPWFTIEREHGGGPYSVMQGNTRIGNTAAPFSETHGASLRTIFDLSNPDATIAIVHTGQSGHPLSPHYDDLATPWAAGDYIALPMSRDAVEAIAAQRLTLVPQ
jgi:penicillin amidase